MQTNLTTSHELHRPPEPMPRERCRLVAELADNARSVREAQSLRHDVFQAEYGVVFDSHDGLDRDTFDKHCRHLLVRDPNTGRVIATTRLLSGERAERAGGYYSELEFDMDNLKKSLSGRVLEIGRTCVHPDFRSGAAITVLWTALAELLLRENYTFLLGCASITLVDGGAQFAGIMQRLRANHMAPDNLRVTPRLAVTESNMVEDQPTMPPLLRSYMRMGAQICGEACWDPSFHCADVFVLLEVAKLSGKYANRFMGRSVNA